jgi:hypothetical protein
MGIMRKARYWGTMSSLSWSALAVAALLVGGCQSDEDTGRGGGGGVGGADGDGTGDGTGDGGGGDDGDGVWDVGGGGSGDGHGGDEQDDGCKKVDLLFVIDDSGSMADEQQNLVTSFPGFIDGIQQELSTTSGYHVGVVTSDAYIYNEAGCTVDGALVTQTGGVSSSNAVCTPFVEGGRYMSEADDLHTKFACAAQVGTGGDGDEHGMHTMQVALSAGMNGAGQCNEGFIRDDALLVIIPITDEQDDHETEGCPPDAGVNPDPLPGSAGDPPLWFDTVVGAKQGIETNVVIVALVGPDGQDGNDVCPPLAKCDGGIEGAEIGTRILEFTRMFTYYSVCPVCAPDYSECFTEAISVIESACDEYTPPG